MGDMAEFFLEASIDELIHPENYEGYVHARRSTSKRCKYCDETGLTWIETNHGWRLGRGGELHTCKNYQHHRG